MHIRTYYRDSNPNRSSRQKASHVRQQAGSAQAVRALMLAFAQEAADAGGDEVVVFLIGEARYGDGSD